jgi:hypothetical protein
VDQNKLSIHVNFKRGRKHDDIAKLCNRYSEKNNKEQIKNLIFFKKIINFLFIIIRYNNKKNSER